MDANRVQAILRACSVFQSSGEQTAIFQTDLIETHLSKREALMICLTEQGFTEHFNVYFLLIFPCISEVLVSHLGQGFWQAVCFYILPLIPFSKINKIMQGSILLGKTIHRGRIISSLLYAFECILGNLACFFQMFE